MQNRLKVLIAIVLVLCSFCAMASAVNGSYGVVDLADGWGYDYRHNPYAWPQCTWYAWGRTYEKLGIELPTWSHARYWADSAAAAGYKVDSTPSANSLFVENWYNSGVEDAFGHVMYIEKVENGYAYYSDSNYKGSEYCEGYFDTSTYMNYRGGEAVGYLGFYRKVIHLTDSSPSEDISFTFEN